MLPALVHSRGAVLGRAESPILQRRCEDEEELFAIAYPCESGMLLSWVKAFTGDAASGNGGGGLGRRSPCWGHHYGTLCPGMSLRVKSLRHRHRPLLGGDTFETSQGWWQLWWCFGWPVRNGDELHLVFVLARKVQE